jgi:GcrA cell cycle regulator
MRYQNSIWNENAEELLTQRWNDGVSFGKIAIELGCGRNAVIGKAHRMGLRREPNYCRDGRPLRRKSADKTTRRRTRRKFNPATLVPNMPRHDPFIADTFIDEAIPVDQRRSLLELTDRSCKWPVGDPGTSEFFFCGAEPVAGLPYCAGHCARAYDGLGRALRPWREARRA